MGDGDPSLALSGQVGSQIKIRVGNKWLLANVRNQKQDRRSPGGIMANIDFLGEGDEERLTGRIHSFRRGVTRYPIPGALIFPATNLIGGSVMLLGVFLTLPFLPLGWIGGMALVSITNESTYLLGATFAIFIQAVLLIGGISSLTRKDTAN